MIDAASSLLDRFLAYEKGYNGQVLIDYTKAHTEIPVFTVAIYMAFITYMPKYLPFPIKLGRVFAVWNVLLSTFSIIGASRVVPTLIAALQDPSHGETLWDRFHWTCCTDPSEWYMMGAPGLWVGLFIYSKFPELLDTAFLVLQKKKVIFLHWFHHCTVLLYCWHAYHHRIAPGIWFAAMNYSVHSIMYFYYFLSCSAVGMRWAVRPFAPFITFIQIAQMFVGITVTVTAANHHAADPESCATDASNWKLGLGMYTAYFILFVVLFWNLYCTKKPDKNKTDEENAAAGVTYKTGCDVGDAAGFFRGKADGKDADDKGEKEN